MCSAFGPAATATMATDNLPFVLNDDKALLCLVKQGSKEVMTLADAMVSATRERGVTEINVVYHSLRPKVQALGIQQS